MAAFIGMLDDVNEPVQTKLTNGDPASLVPWRFCEQHNFYFLYANKCLHCLSVIKEQEAEP